MWYPLPNMRMERFPGNSHFGIRTPVENKCVIQLERGDDISFGFLYDLGYRFTSSHLGLSPGGRLQSISQYPSVELQPRTAGRPGTPLRFLATPLL